MKPTLVQPHKSAIGANMVALIAYVAVFLPHVISAIFSWDFSLILVNFFVLAVPALLFFSEKESSFIKTHTVQALSIGLILSVVTAVLNFINWLFGSFLYYISYLYFLWIIGLLVTIFSYIVLVAVLAFVVYIVVMLVKYKSIELPGVAAVVKLLDGMRPKPKQAQPAQAYAQPYAHQAPPQTESAPVAESNTENNTNINGQDNA